MKAAMQGFVCGWSPLLCHIIYSWSSTHGFPSFTLSYQPYLKESRLIAAMFYGVWLMTSTPNSQISTDMGLTNYLNFGKILKIEEYTERLQLFGTVFVIFYGCFIKDMMIEFDVVRQTPFKVVFKLPITSFCSQLLYDW